MSGLRIENLSGFGIGIGECNFVRLDFDVGSFARSDADIAAGVLNLDGAIGCDLCLEDLLVVIALWAAEGVEEVIALIPNLGAKRSPPVVPAGGAKADEGQQEEDANKAAAAADGSLALRVKSPLA